MLTWFPLMHCAFSKASLCLLFAVFFSYLLNLLPFELRFIWFHSVISICFFKTVKLDSNLNEHAMPIFRHIREGVPLRRRAKDWKTEDGSGGSIMWSRVSSSGQVPRFRRQGRLRNTILHKHPFTLAFTIYFDLGAWTSWRWCGQQTSPIPTSQLATVLRIRTRRRTASGSPKLEWPS